MNELVVLLAGQEIGRLSRDGARLTFRYLDMWRRDPSSTALSVSMPLSTEAHPHEKIAPFIQGLLPDSEAVIARWSQRFHVSPTNLFGLIANVGEDCAGAVQFVAPERLGTLASPESSGVEWLTTRDVESRLAGLRSDHAAWRSERDSGQFSLAGAQPKTALVRDGKRWGVPRGQIATTHILKPPVLGFEGFAENEHCCLALARALGLPAAQSKVETFGSEVAIVVTRFDRIATASLILRGTSADDREALADLARSRPILRLHQEDLCQALGLMPSLKYQNEGGPTPQMIVDLLRRSSSSSDEDVNTFIDALALSWLIGGTDAHAKNYALLHATGGRVRLAPLYDLASVLPYSELPMKKLKLAMKIGGSYRLHEIGAAHFRSLAIEVSCRESDVLERALFLAERVPDAAKDVSARAHADGLVHPIIDRWAKTLTTRARTCAKALKAAL